MSAALVLLSFVTLSRLAELVWARRNTARLLASGAVERGASHYPLIVALHAGWLASLWIGLWLQGPLVEVDFGWIAVFIVLQGLRAWVLITLGRRWTTRILVIPGERLICDGPYRFLRHPNYIVVVGEIAVVPLTLGLPIQAVVFSVLNAAVLAVRLSAETAALAKASRPESP